jgi:nucleotide-binding universal stress UspA family protein
MKIPSVVSRGAPPVSAIRSLLLHLDATAGSATRLALARSIAARHGARITAMFGVRPDPERIAYAYSAGAALRAAEAQQTLAWAPERDQLLALCGDDELGPTWCDVVGDSVAHAFLAEAAYADLLVLGRPSRSDETGGAPPNLVETAILESGVPAIVVPPARQHETVGERILVAWNGTPQAARALRAALPFMTRAAEVHVASWAATSPTAPCSRLDVAGWLHRHDIDARVELHRSSAHVGEEIAKAALRLDADLVVMGCYGHARLRERLFGGATRSSLAALPVPILMEH